MVSTVAELIDKALRDFLEPGDSQPTRLVLDADITDSDTTLTYDSSYISPEELELLGAGNIIEIGTEQILAGSVDETANTISGLVRGINGTDAATHTAGDVIVLSPIWPRQTLLEAAGHAIVNLWPDLYGVEAGTELSLSSSTFTEVPANVEDIINLWVLSAGNYVDAPYSFLNPFPPSSTNKAVSTPTYYGAAAYPTYKTKFTKPASEATTLASLNVEEEWVEIIVLGMVAYLINSRDIDELTEEHIDAQMTERQPLRGTSLRDRLLTYRQFLIDQAKKAQRFEYPTRMVQM